MSWFLKVREGIRFDRNELAGSFGDIGTDFPLITAMILVADLDAASVLIMFGVMQILTGLAYGLPMPAQPLKAVAAIVLTQKISSGVLYGGGLAIGVVMLVLTLTGLTNWLAASVPKVVVRGIQFGLGLQLATLAASEYIPSEGVMGYLLAGLAFAITITLLGNRRIPPALLVILLGMVFALIFKVEVGVLTRNIGLALPAPHLPEASEIWTGFLVLALAQIPLSLGNSILATHQVASDLFPRKAPSIRKISLTYSTMNLVNPFLSGIPTCHGSGGIVGHYTFGARTGGSVLLYGLLYLVLGLFFSNAFNEVIHFFPQPVLGVILAFEGIGLMLLVRDVAESDGSFMLVLLVGIMAITLPYGYLLGLVVGTLLFYSGHRTAVGLDVESSED